MEADFRLIEFRITGVNGFHLPSWTDGRLYLVSYGAQETTRSADGLHLDG